MLREVDRARWLISLGLLIGLLAGCSGSGGTESGTTPGSGTTGPDKVTTSASGNVGSSGGGVVLPNLATLFVPAGATGNITATVEAMTSPMMDELASEVTTGFEFLPGVPKLRVLLSQRPIKLVRLAIAIPNLTQLLPTTHNLVIAKLQYEAESDEEEPHAVLGPVVGEVCEEKTAVCLFLLPGWFSEVSGSGGFQVQIGIGRAPDNPQQVTLHWWDRLFMTATAYAVETPWHLWTFTNASPAALEVSPDASNRLHVGGRIALESNLPSLAPPLAGALQITSDFGPRSVSGNASASTYHEAVDFRAAVSTSVSPVLSGTEVVNNNSTKVKCKNGTESNLKYVNIRSGAGVLLVRYLHLSQTTNSAGLLAMKSGMSGTCAPHLDVRMQFKDEFKAEGTVDPWPLINNEPDRFMLTKDDPIVTGECVGCREIFDFRYVLTVAAGKYLNPGFVGPLNIFTKDMDWPKPATAYVLTSEDGTFDVSSFPKDVTNGKYKLRLSLCSESIGGCRIVRDWTINTSTGVPYSSSYRTTSVELGAPIREECDAQGRCMRTLFCNPGDVVGNVESVQEQWALDASAGTAGLVSDSRTYRGTFNPVTGQVLVIYTREREDITPTGSDIRFFSTQSSTLTAAYDSVTRIIRGNFVDSVATLWSRDARSVSCRSMFAYESRPIP